MELKVEPEMFRVIKGENSISGPALLKHFVTKSNPAKQRLSFI
jgi:hypothetical protein